MKTLLIYRKNHETERTALDYIRDFKMRTGRDLDTMDADTPEGIELCRLYDIMDYPAILVRNDDGHMQNLWMGAGSMPTISEVSYYVTGGGESSARSL